mgnify:CR=1 FL=1
MLKHNAAMLSIASNTVLIIFKIITGVMVGSISIISEAIHSFMDLLASIIAYFSIKEAEKTKDEHHPFGHKKYENVSGFTEALLIIFAAAIIISEATKKIIYGFELNDVTLGIIVMLISAIVNLVISRILFKVSKRTNSIALEADAYHLLTDVVTSLGVFLGLLLVKFTHLQLLDPLTAILVGLLIIKTGISLIEKSMKDLVDSSLSNEEINKISKIIKSHFQVISYHELRTRKSGDQREIDLHLDVNVDCTLLEAHNICNLIETEIEVVYPKSHVMIHYEPAYGNETLR